MKPYAVIFLIGLFYLAVISETAAQKPTCQGNSYSTQIVSKKVVSETCVKYEIKVSYDGSRTFGLSHYSIGIPCGEIKNVTNSENWKQVFGTDPTTNVYGLKIEDIKGFGEKGADSFIIKFTWCAEISCDKKLDVVAYKAGQCIDYDNLNDSSAGNGGDNDKEDDNKSNDGNCGNPSHNHGKDGSGKDSSCGNDGKGGKDNGNKGNDGKGDHDKDKGGNGNDGKGGSDKEKGGKDNDEKDKDNKGSCGNPSHDHGKDDRGKDGNCDNDGKGGDKDKDDKDGDGDGKDKDDKSSCGNPSHDHGKDGSGKDGSCGNGGGNDGGGSGQQPTCDGNSYSTEITSKKTVSETCVEYEVKVSYDGTRSFGLSHITMAIPCGELKNISNSEDWKQVVGKDPTTDVYGLKIDDIKDFGSNGADSFTIKFTWCSDASCDKTLGTVSYKAGQCIDYDTLEDHGGDDGTGGGDDTDGGGIGDGGDGNGDDDSDPDTGGENPDNTCSTLIAKLQKVNLTCSSGKTGLIQVIIEDGLGPYTYAWSTGETTSSIQNLTEGNYGVTVTDANGNTMTLSETISAPATILINESIIHPSCNGFTNGEINLSITGGSGAFTFAWSNGTTQQNLTNLGSGTYSVVVTDAAGCTSQKTITLTNTTVITTGVSFSHPSCGQNNGTIDITPNGGVAPYTYLWSNGITTQDLQNSGPGTYSVKITDATGCSIDMVYALRINNTLVLKYTITPTNCVDDSSGTINLTVSGGTAPYTYLWQDGIATEDRSGLKTGLYKVTVTDAGGCTSSVNINVFKKTFTVDSQISQPLCVGDLGSVTITPVDGIAPYTYSWSNGEKDNSITGVSSGNYSVTIMDASGCSVNMVFIITSVTAISATNTVSNSQCGNQGAYAIDLSVTGGKSPYTYVWSNGATTQDLSGLTSGTYTVQIKDVNSCAASQEIVVNPISASWSCLINQPAAEAVCKSAGNTMSTSIMDASTYLWNVFSTDNSWVITAGSNVSSVVYTAGNAGTSATFTLTITKDGCSKTCTYTTSTNGCIERDNTGGGDPSTGDPCASESASATPPATSQEAEVTTDETHTEPSEQTPTETSDEIETESSEEIEAASTEENLPTELQVSAYPNPFIDRVNFEWTCTEDEYVQVEILDLLGRRASVIFSGNVRKGHSYKCDWTPTGSDRIYVYRYNSSKNKHQGKLFMK